MKFNEWVQWVKNNGGIDYDGAYGRQCVDLAQHYADKVLGISGAFFNLDYAYEIYTNYSKLPKIRNNFKLIDATVHGEYPKRGDVVVWSKKKNGYAGHVAICLSGDSDGFTVFEQNYDGKGGIREYKYTYKNVSGWLRPKDQSNLKYGNAYMLSAQDVYCDSLLQTKIGSVSKGEGVYLDGSGSGNDQIVYRCGNYYKTGYVKGGTVKKN